MYGFKMTRFMLCKYHAIAEQSRLLPNAGLIKQANFDVLAKCTALPD
jgi:hypothetical protein